MHGIYWEVLLGALTCRRVKEAGWSVEREAERSRGTRARMALQGCPSYYPVFSRERQNQQKIHVSPTSNRKER